MEVIAAKRARAASFPSPPPPVDVVYFIQAESGGPIKIGYTKNVPARLRALRNSGPLPLRVLVTLPGGEYLERELHHRFRLDRLHGEWFSPCPALLAFIASSTPESR